MGGGRAGLGREQILIYFPCVFEVLEAVNQACLAQINLRKQSMPRVEEARNVF